MTIQSLTQGRTIIFNEEEHNAKMLQRREAFLAAKAANPNDIKYMRNTDLKSVAKDASDLVFFGVHNISASLTENLASNVKSYNQTRDDIIKNYTDGAERTQKLVNLEKRFYDSVDSGIKHALGYHLGQGISTDTDEYKKLLNEIKESVPASEMRDKMTAILTKRFETPVTGYVSDYNEARENIMANYPDGEEKTQKLDSLDMKFGYDIDEAIHGLFLARLSVSGIIADFAGDTETYKKLYNEIQENVPGGDLRDKMTEILDENFKNVMEVNSREMYFFTFNIQKPYGFEMSTKDPLYAETLAKYKSEYQKGLDISNARVKIEKEISQLYSDIIDNNINVLLNGAYDSRYMSGQYRFSLNDVEILSGGFWADLSKENIELEDAGIKGEEKYAVLSKKLKESGLGKYAQKKLDDFIKML